MPSSRARWSVAMLSASSTGPYVPDMPMHPRPIAVTSGPARPRRFVFSILCKVATAEGLASTRANHDLMTEHEASRTLVKSPPELWAECSDADSLGRHLDGFGDIRITRLEPETAVAWEGELASGTVRLEPSGWGTKVILTAAASVDAPEIEPEPVAEAPADPEPEPQPIHQPAPGAPAREGLWGRVRRWLMGPTVAEDELLVLAPPEPESASPEPEPAAVEPEAVPGVNATAALTAALDSLGQ